MAPRPLTRRTLLRLAAITAAGIAWAPSPAAAAEMAEVSPGLRIYRRSTWGAGSPAKGALSSEPDVRVLAVHHSADATQHAAGEVPAILRGYFAAHTGPAKGWPDIAYNFLIDRYGGVWEGRTGSIDAAVRGDATGGNQGFTQLVCLIGNFTTEMPTDAAIASLVSTLRWLSARHGIDVRPGVTATFVSRGSNRWPAGAQVTVPTISGHRELSKTACPGNRFFPYVRDSLPAAVSGTARPATATTTTTAPAPPITTTTSAAPPTTSSSSTTAPPAPASPPSTAGPGDAVSSGAAAASERTTGNDGSAVPTVAAAGTAVGVAGVVGAAVVARRRRQTADLKALHSGETPGDGVPTTK